MKRLLAILLCLPLCASAIELFEQDERGNINQRNVGAFKSKLTDRVGSRAEMPTTRTRALSQFDSLELNVPVDLVYRETGPARLEIEAPLSIHKALRYQVIAGVLTIEMNHGFHSTGPIKLKLYGGKLRHITIDGASDAQFYGVSADQFKAHISGSADVGVSGRSRTCELVSLGAGDIDFSGLRCDEAKVKATGVADLRLTAMKSVSGLLQGAGELVVFGSPSSRRIEVQGAFDLDYR